MIKNYFKIALRNLVKHKFISCINLFGLTIGLTSCLLILAYVANEMSYDRFNNNSENIYRVERTFLNQDTKEVSLSLGSVAPPFAPLLFNDFKEIEKITTLLPNGRTSFKYNDKVFNERNVYYADENLFDVFKVEMIRGNPVSALSDPFSVILTEEIANKYFGAEDPLNKMIRLDNAVTCRVTGIYKAFPLNSHLHPQVMVSFNTLKDSTVYGAEQLRTNWGNNSFFTYVVLPENYNIKNMEARFPAFQDRHIRDGGTVKPSEYSKLSLRKLTDIHLTSHTDYEAEENGDIKRVYIFSAVALFILLIACINYMNLSTARSVLRAREIGVRKVVGARKSELVMQFLSESVLISLISTLFAFGLTWLLIPGLNKIAGQELTIDLLLRWNTLIPVLLTPFIIGLLSGIYPALFLSSFKPIRVLKGVMKQGSSDISFRKVLVVVQFSSSIILIIATAIVFQQLKYMRNNSLGYNKDHIVILQGAGGLNDNYESFKTQLLANSNIISLARSSRIPTGRLLDAMGSKLNRGDSLAPTNVDIKFVRADEDYLPTYGIRTVAGRNFSREHATDSSGFLINESAARALGMAPQKAVGKAFKYGGMPGTIIGVVNDFHFESLHQRITPLVLFQPDGNTSNISVKISGQNTKAALAHLEAAWKKFLPEAPFEYGFLDERFESLYQSEQRQAHIFTMFSSIALFIACLGLFGLSAFTITQRVKEIGIRKVLGASISQIVKVLSVDFLKLVLIAAMVGIPIAWFAMNNWLEDFAYRIDVQWWVLIMACIAAGTVAFLTISFQAVKAAMMNPVNSLRSE